MIFSTALLALALSTVDARPMKRAYEGWMTYTYGGGALGACGKPMVDEQSMIAVGWQFFQSHDVAGNSNLNSLCGQPITVRGETGSRTLYIWDSCGGCGEYGIDVPPAAFQAIGGQNAINAGRQWISWEFGTGAPAPANQGNAGTPQTGPAPITPVNIGATCTHSTSPFQQGDSGCTTGCCVNGQCAPCESCWGANVCASAAAGNSGSAPAPAPSGGSSVAPSSGCNVGDMQCSGTGFATCIAGGIWVTQSCPPNLHCQMGAHGVECAA